MLVSSLISAGKWCRRQRSVPPCSNTSLLVVATSPLLGFKSQMCHALQKTACTKMAARCNDVLKRSLTDGNRILNKLDSPKNDNYHNIEQQQLKKITDHAQSVHRHQLQTRIIQNCISKGGHITVHSVHRNEPSPDSPFPWSRFVSCDMAQVQHTSTQQQCTTCPWWLTTVCRQTPRNCGRRVCPNSFEGPCSWKECAGRTDSVPQWHPPKATAGPRLATVMLLATRIEAVFDRSTCGSSEKVKHKLDTNVGARFGGTVLRDGAIGEQLVMEATSSAQHVFMRDCAHGRNGSHIATMIPMTSSFRTFWLCLPLTTYTRKVIETEWSKGAEKQSPHCS